MGTTSTTLEEQKQIWFIANNDIFDSIFCCANLLRERRELASHYLNIDSNSENIHQENNLKKFVKN